MTTTGPTIETSDAVRTRTVPGPGRRWTSRRRPGCSATGSATSGTGCARSSPRRSPQRRLGSTARHVRPQQLPGAPRRAGRADLPASVGRHGGPATSPTPRPWRRSPPLRRDEPRVHDAACTRATPSEGRDEELAERTSPVCSTLRLRLAGHHGAGRRKRRGGLKTRAVPQATTRPNPRSTGSAGRDVHHHRRPSDVLVCFATVDRRSAGRGITAFVVDGDAPGLTRGQPSPRWACTADHRRLFLEQWRCPRRNRLGAEGDGWPIVLASVVKSRISAAAQGVGIPGPRTRARSTPCTVPTGGGHRTRTTFALAELRGEILQGRLLLLSIAREVDKDEAPSPGQIAS